MKLSKQEREHLELCQEAKNFRQSNLFKALQSHLMLQLDKKYPEPSDLRDKWVEQYRYAKAYEKAAESIINFFQGLESAHEVLTEKVKQKESDLE
jgi:hypothetical protein